MKIRKYRATDRAALIDLWQSVFPNDPPHNEPAGVIDAKLAVDDLIFVAADGDRLAGGCIAGYDGHRGWLYAVAVANPYRRSGVGTNLVRQALGALRDLGCSKVNLQIRAGNEAVEAFYQSLGFDTEARTSMGQLLDRGVRRALAKRPGS